MKRLRETDVGRWKVILSIGEAAYVLERWHGYRLHDRMYYRDWADTNTIFDNYVREFAIREMKEALDLIGD